MNSLQAAISWSGKNVSLCLFVVWPVAYKEGEPPAPVGMLQQPAIVRAYELEDEKRVLGGRRTIEVDLIFDEMPENLDRLIEGWLRSSTGGGAVVAWFGFEGSFHFDHILTTDIADQIYGIATRELVALATDDRFRESERWADQLKSIRGVIA